METKDLNYPPELPVCEHRAEILSAMKASPVVIVCGDTGSGKTTQLPKMALELGRAAHGRRIVCTQPRRLAAVTVAERVAEELKAEVGGLVGFRHRFARRISSETRIEFMTDGVLLAETRFDALLRAYDTIIIDEAHERTLNVDFLLGILKRILEKRRDLKVVVSSATLDAARFSAFFGNAPVISVPGRLFPIEIKYRPPPEDEDRDLPRDVAAAVAELPPDGDILVFLPGERDIRETADLLADVRADDDVIPLLASLPASEQRRAFLPSPRRRIILATNIAETSVTIPGIRAVVDSGLARISRYVHRTQVQRLQVEPVSQASARQRAGRCGRVGPGVCLRLYSEEDFASRDAYTPPEVLRSSLAGVILALLDLRLGDIDKFPFIDPPKPAMVREGLRELLELGAIGRAGVGPDAREVVLTDVGRRLARIPVEPRLARMLLAASQNAVLPSVLPIVAAMACDDPRRRPMDEREKAEQSHARFRVAGSDFLGTLKLWQWWNDETKDLSQSKSRKLCKASYLSYPKMREWRDLVHQLETLSKRIGLDAASDNGGPDMIHRSLLSGLLGRIGRYDEDERNYRGAHGLRFAIHPSSALARKRAKDKPPPAGRQAPAAKRQAPDWIMAGELVDTSRMFARNAAVIDVRWLEPVAGPMCRHSYHSPEWDAQTGFVRATEQVTLYGLVIVQGRRCDYSRIDPAVSRAVFIRRGLIDGEFPNPPPQVRGNNRLLDALRRRAERSRRPDTLDADGIFAHFDKVIPQGICSANALRKWLRAAPAAETEPFVLKQTDWWPDESASDRDFPDSLRIAGAKLSLSYRHSPDDPENDGVTCSIRRSDVSVLRLWRSDWLVPGMLPEKISWMLNTLPSALRRTLAPISDSTAILLSLLKPGAQPLEDAVREAACRRWGVRIPNGAWDWSKLPPHLKMRFRVRDDTTGRTVALSRDLDEVLRAVGAPRGGASAAPRQSAVCRTWEFGTIPESQTDRNSSWETTFHPALHDEGDGVTLKLYADPAISAEVHAAGVTRLFLLALRKAASVPFRRSRIPLDAALYLKEMDYADEAVAGDVLHGAVRETMVLGRPPVRTAEEFESRLREGRAPLLKAQAEITAVLVDSAAEAMRISRQMEDGRIPEATADSVSTQLAWLLYRGFPRAVPLAAMRHYRRYLRGAAIRLERARLNPAADMAKEAKLSPYWESYRAALSKRDQCDHAALDEFRWMIEEYRVSLFAQELRTPQPVSPKRLDAKWAAVGLQG